MNVSVIYTLPSQSVFGPPQGQVHLFLLFVSEALADRKVVTLIAVREHRRRGEKRVRREEAKQ